MKKFLYSKKALKFVTRYAPSFLSIVLDFLHLFFFFFCSLYTIPNHEEIYNKKHFFFVSFLRWLFLHLIETIVYIHVCIIVFVCVIVSVLDNLCIMICKFYWIFIFYFIQTIMDFDY